MVEANPQGIEPSMIRSLGGMCTMASYLDQREVTKLQRLSKYMYDVGVQRI